MGNQEGCQPTLPLSSIRLVALIYDNLSVRSPSPQLIFTILSLGELGPDIQLVKPTPTPKVEQ